MYDNALRERLHSIASNQPADSIDVDRLVERGQRSLRRRRVAGTAASALAVVGVVTSTMLLSDLGPAADAPPVAQAPSAQAQAPNASSAPTEAEYVTYMVENITEGSLPTQWLLPNGQIKPNAPASIWPAKLPRLATVTVRCSGTTTTQVTVVPHLGWTWDNHAVPDQVDGFDKNNRYITMRALTVTLTKGDRTSRASLICGGDVFPKPWGNFDR